VGKWTRSPLGGGKKSARKKRTLDGQEEEKKITGQGKSPQIPERQAIINFGDGRA